MLCVLELKLVKSWSPGSSGNCLVQHFNKPMETGLFPRFRVEKVPIKKCQWGLSSALPSGMWAPGEQGSVNLLTAPPPGLEWHLAHSGQITNSYSMAGWWYRHRWVNMRKRMTGLEWPLVWRGKQSHKQQSKGTLCSPNSHGCATVSQENYMKGFFMVVQ